MATAFRSTTRGCRAELDQHERRLLSRLCGDVVTILEGRTEDVSEDADDAAPASGAADAPADAYPDAGMDDSVFAHFSAELAGLDGDDSLAAPEDPVLRRLLPDASTDDEEAGRFRRLSESSLRAAKIADLRAARMLLESSPVHVTDEQAPLLGRALNDVRLTLSARIGIEDEADAEAVQRRAVRDDGGDQETFMAEVYTFVTWLQETLFSAMLEAMPDDGAPDAAADDVEDADTDTDTDADDAEGGAADGRRA
ncbi:DUF2017 domain-containing protein [Nesterenkonia halophila]